MQLRYYAYYKRWALINEEGEVLNWLSNSTAG